MLDIQFIMGFIGAAIGLIIGIFVFSAVTESVECPDPAVDANGAESCDRALSMAWTVIGIFPISLFIALFAIFGGFKNLSMG